MPRCVLLSSSHVPSQDSCRRCVTRIDAAGAERKPAAQRWAPATASVNPREADSRRNVDAPVGSNQRFCMVSPRRADACRGIQASVADMRERACAGP
eukprot:3201654-Rhodomonas_salina.1